VGQGSGGNWVGAWKVRMATGMGWEGEEWGQKGVVNGRGGNREGGSVVK